ncbi:MAG: toll/interleukin-1 receptor domain-containing protein [Bacteroidota bacterium]
MTDVFVSYSRQDKDFANRLVNRLEIDRRDVWVDWQDIPRGEQWINEIKSGIENTNNFVFVVTRNSLTSEICHLEIEHARKQNKRIIPIIRQKIEGDTEKIIKGEWLGQDWQNVAIDNWMVLTSINWVFANDDDTFERMFTELVEAIETDYTHVKLHTRYQVRALDWFRTNENPSFLLTGDEIVSAENWLQSSQGKEPKPSALQREYILRSHEVEERRNNEIAAMEQRIKRIEQVTRAARRSIIALLIVGFVVGLCSIFVFNMLREDFTYEEQIQGTSVAVETLVAN